MLVWPPRLAQPDCGNDVWLVPEHLGGCALHQTHDGRLGQGGLGTAWRGSPRVL